MKLLSALLLACLSAAWAQTTPSPAAVPASAPNATLPDLPDETVIATLYDGSKITMGQYKSLYGALPPQMQPMAIRDPKGFLNEYSLMRRLTKMAEEGKIDQESPYKEALEISRIFTLSQAQILEI